MTAAGVNEDDIPACDAFIADFEAQLIIFMDAQREIRGLL